MVDCGSEVGGWSAEGDTAIDCHPLAALRMKLARAEIAVLIRNANGARIGLRKFLDNATISGLVPCRPDAEESTGPLSGIGAHVALDRILDHVREKQSSCPLPFGAGATMRSRPFALAVRGAGL